MSRMEWISTALATSELNRETIPPEFAGTPHRRLVLAAFDSSAGPADMAVLLRNVIRYENKAQGWADAIQVPRRLIEIAMPKLEHAGVSAATESVSSLRASEWRPAWLEGSGEFEVDDCAYPTQRRPKEFCVGDPVLAALKLERYTSVAQRDAVRAVLCAKAGDTLAICMPTGAGKSLCASFPSIQPSSGDNDALGVSVIIVPTVALALDLAKRLEESVGHPIAYRPENVEEAELILARCEAGIQGPVITSPEALISTLFKPLQAAARKGLLRNFVIDEAHMVLSWGDEFRPAFLQLAATRRELLNTPGSNGFFTLLLSATFTDYHLRWLKEMFAEEGRFRIIHAARLRPEPAYWGAQAIDNGEREAWLLEAIFHLPRPCIVYTTRREDCVHWYNVFRRVGFARLGMMTGDTGPEERRQLLNKWMSDDLDLMVATSAFGLGIDKPDVRTIIHAQLPETVDRFYQDVGRAGRDGCACVSLLLTTREDWRSVAGIGRPTFISATRGLERWKRMHDAARHVGGDLLIDIRTGVEMDTIKSDYNTAWNLRTLQLMQRAGALEFVRTTQAGNRFEIAVRCAPVLHLDETYWTTHIENLRGALYEDQAQSSAYLRRLVRRSADCLSVLFANCYESPTFGLSVVLACGGCLACRNSGRSPFVGRILARFSPPGPLPPVECSTEVEGVFQGQRGAFIFYPSHLEGQSLCGAVATPLKWFAIRGARNFVGPNDCLELLENISGKLRHTAIFWNERPPRALDISAAQMMIVLLTRAMPGWWPAFWDNILHFPGRCVILAPYDIRDPRVPARLLRESVNLPWWDLEQWENRFVA